MSLALLSWQIASVRVSLIFYVQIFCWLNELFSDAYFLVVELICLLSKEFALVVVNIVIIECFDSNY